MSLFVSNVKVFVDGHEIGTVSQVSAPMIDRSECDSVKAVERNVTVECSFELAPNALPIVNDIIVSSRLGSTWKN